jgi:alpha-galactosidase
MHSKTRGARVLAVRSCVLVISAALSLALLASISGEVRGQTQGNYDLVGTWLIHPPSAPGVATVRTVTFRKSAQGITGVWSDWTNRASKDSRLSDIQTDGHTLSFSVNYVGEGADKWRGEFTDSDHLRMTWLADDGTPYETRAFERVSATDLERVKAATPKLFTGVAPLPALRDVPSNGLAQTPVMGWSSWNYLRKAVDDRSIREMADAIVSSGLRDAGYVYVDIDDSWEGRRDARGVIHPNEKFPDMKALADYLHSKGLKFGIYSSPGPLTCAGYIGSYGYEKQDAQTFAAWGVDLLKYDWCSAGEMYTTQAEMQAVFQKMGEALRATGRPIVYSLGAYGRFDVGKWGRTVGGNLWRTGGDSVFGGRWATVSTRFDSDGDPDDNGPGGWNDPDLLLIGNGGLTADEYRSHMTLWAMLAAPLIIGNDVRTMSAEVASILLNRDVIAVDQDRLGQQGRRVQNQNSVEVWTKRLGDGSTAVAIYNRGAAKAEFSIRWADIGLSGVARVRDLWAQTNWAESKDRYTTTLFSHGCALLNVSTVE